MIKNIIIGSFLVILTFLDEPECTEKWCLKSPRFLQIRCQFEPKCHITDILVWTPLQVRKDCKSVLFFNKLTSRNKIITGNTTNNLFYDIFWICYVCVAYIYYKLSDCLFVGLWVCVWPNSSQTKAPILINEVSN